MANTPLQKKIKALWIVLWHLGVIPNPSDAALIGFCQRVTGGGESGIQSLTWLHGGDANKVIEALKARAERDGGVNWQSYGGDAYHPRARVMEAQWCRLHDLGVVRIRDTGALANWVGSVLKRPNKISHTQISNSDADRIIRALGEKIRRVQKIDTERSE